MNKKFIKMFLLHVLIFSLLGAVMIIIGAIEAFGQPIAPFYLSVPVFNEADGYVKISLIFNEYEQGRYPAPVFGKIEGTINLSFSNSGYGDGEIGDLPTISGNSPERQYHIEKMSGDERNKFFYFIAEDNTHNYPFEIQNDDTLLTFKFPISPPYSDTLKIIFSNIRIPSFLEYSFTQEIVLKAEHMKSVGFSIEPSPLYFRLGSKELKADMNIIYSESAIDSVVFSLIFNSFALKDLSIGINGWDLKIVGPAKMGEINHYGITARAKSSDKALPASDSLRLLFKITIGPLEDYIEPGESYYMNIPSLNMKVFFQGKELVEKGPGTAIINVDVGLKRDIDRDGRIRLNDGVLALEHVMGMGELTGEAFWAGDVYDDGDVDLDDVADILRSAGPGKYALMKLEAKDTLDITDAIILTEALVAIIKGDNLSVVTEGIFYSSHFTSDNKYFVGYCNKFSGVFKFNSGAIIDYGYAICQPTSAEVEEKNSFASISCYPNPFCDRLTINYVLEKSSNVKITIFNALGLVVEELINKYQFLGPQNIIFIPNRLSSEAYYCQIIIGNESKIIPLVYVK